MPRFPLLLLFLLFVLNTSFAQSDYTASYEAGNQKYKEKDYAGALADFKNAARLDKESADAWYMAALCNYMLGKYEEAIPDFNLSAKIKGDVYDVYYYRGLCKYFLGRYEEAKTDFSLSTNYKADYAYSYYYRAMSKHFLKNYDEAEKDFNLSITLDGGNSDAYLYRGASRYFLSRDAEALADLNKSIQMYEKSADAFYYRGLVKYHLAKDAEAVEDFTKSIEINPLYDAYYYRGAAKYMLKNYDGAFSDYNMSSALKPDYFQAWQEKGMAAYMLSKDDEAIKNFDKAIQLNPKSGKSYYYRGMSKKYKGDVVGSEQDIKKAGELGYSESGGSTSKTYSSTKSAGSGGISSSIPYVDWLNPILDNMNISEDKFLLQACLKSSEKIASCKLNVNGAESAGQITEQAGNADCRFILKQNIELKQGSNQVKITITNSKGESTTESRNIIVNKALSAKAGEKRIALIIGNSAYKNSGQLKNPVNDAELMASTLGKLGFYVIKRTDADKKSMEDAVKEFSKKIPEYNVVLFYYAGHGMQVDGENFLLPIDVTLMDKADIKFEAVSVNFVVEELERYPNNTSVVILDACRNNPFRSFSRGGEQGFKAIPAASGTIISFATSEGSVASDGAGNNGLYTEELVKQIVVPQPIESVFKKTRVAVEEKSNNQQSPQEWSKLRGDFYFVK